MAAATAGAMVKVRAVVTASSAPVPPTSEAPAVRSQVSIRVSEMVAWGGFRVEWA